MSDDELAEARRLAVQAVVEYAVEVQNEWGPYDELDRLVYWCAPTDSPQWLTSEVLTRLESLHRMHGAFLR